MKALRVIRLLTPLTSKPHKILPNYPHFNRFLSAQPQQDDSINTNDPQEPPLSTPDFNSEDYTLPDFDSTPTKLTSIWQQSYRAKADRIVLSEDEQRLKKAENEQKLKKAENERRRMLEKALLDAAFEKPDYMDDAHMIVKEEDQMSLSVGIIGAPNAGKSSLTNLMAGTKIAAVSRKTNTTTHEVLGVMTKGNTQICFFDTPGLMLKSNGYPAKTDALMRAESAWSSVDLYDVLIVMFDVNRHLTSPDKRVAKLIAHLGAEEHPKQKRVLCMNKVDLVENKKDLLKVAKEFAALPGYHRYFMISALKGSGVKDLSRFLTDQAVKRPWDEDPTIMTEEYMKNTSLEVVREKMLHYIHQEIPYALDHRLVHWKELRDGSVRIEQHFITDKESQRKILVGKNGSKIGRIGMEANEELRVLFKRNVHLFLQVRVS